MCGICFSVKQRYFRCGGSKRHRTPVPGLTCMPQDCSTAHSSAPDVYAAQGVEPYELRACTHRGVPLRVVNLHGCRRQYYPPAESSLFTKLIDNIRRRGPETFGATRQTLEEYTLEPSTGTDGGVAADGLLMQADVQGVSAVLGLRGQTTVHQPYEIEIEMDQDDDVGMQHANKSFLMWNGEIFNGAMCPPPWGSDTVVLASRLAQLEQECVSMRVGDAMSRLSLRERQALFLRRCVDVFESEIEGPYGFLFYANRLQISVYGRDPLGRHSLLTHVSVHPGTTTDAATTLAEVELLISSVGVQHNSAVGREDRAAGSGDPNSVGSPSHEPAWQKRLREQDEEEGDTEPECCWSELPVTGLFGVPFSCPLLQHGRDRSVLREPLVAPDAAVIVLHCPWRNRFHLVHPLLRAAVASEEAAEAAAKGLPGPLPGKAEALSPPPVLPPLLAELIAHSQPAADNVDDQWDHGAAVRYLYALAGAVRRRTDVTTSGAEDNRSVHKVSQARRRPLCVLFSGGIDCTILAALAHYTLPVETPIELVNVVFGACPERAPDRVAAMRAVEELLQLPQPPPGGPGGDGSEVVSEREWRLVLVDVPEKSSENTPHILDLITPQHTVLDLDIGTALWYASRGFGRMQLLRHSDVAGVGLLDSTDASRSSTSASAGSHSNGTAHPWPSLLDGFSKHYRITTAAPQSTSLQSKAVVAADPSSKFDLLLEVLISEARQSGGPDKPVLLSTLGKEYGMFLQPHIVAHGYKKLGHYLNDACHAGFVHFDHTAPSKAVRLARVEDQRRATEDQPCQWFMTPAMSAEGRRTPPDGQSDPNYQSKAKVLLLGMGADETLGGYTRYRRYFQSQGIAGARRELAKDFYRLWKRNLGRDDRITMDNGRESRLPFLDEELLRTLDGIITTRREQLLGENAKLGAAALSPERILEKSMESVISFRLGPGEGDKRILRRAAAIIGLKGVTRLQKRALQFGSRIAERRTPGSALLVNH